MYCYYCLVVRATESVLAETTLADLGARAARVCWCKCTGCTTKKVPRASARFAPLRKCHEQNSCMFLAVQPLHLHQHTRAARARKSANMVSANMVSILPTASAGLRTARQGATKR